MPASLAERRQQRHARKRAAALALVRRCPRCQRRGNFRRVDRDLLLNVSSWRCHHCRAVFTP